jgi:hypothetical protein
MRRFRVTRWHVWATGIAVALAVAASSLALAGAAAADHPAAGPPARALCSSGYVDATIGGEHKCLRAGQFCSAEHEGDYERYGFICLNGRLEKLGTTAQPPPTTTAEVPATPPSTT